MADKTYDGIRKKRGSEKRRFHVHVPDSAKMARKKGGREKNRNATKLRDVSPGER